MKKKLIQKLIQKLINNLDVKILSLVLAFLLWLIVMNVSDPTETREFEDIPVKVTNADAIEDVDKLYTIVSGNTVDITVEGPQSIVRELKAADFTAIADLSKTSPVGAVIIDVKAPPMYEEELTITTGKRNDEVMIISMEDRTSDTFRINVRTEGTPFTGYYVMPGYEASPKMVEVSGAASKIQDIKEVVAQVSVKWKSASFTTTTELKAYNAYGYEVEGIEFDTDEVEVSVNVVPMKEITVSVLPQGIAAEGFAVSGIKNEPDMITIAGEATALAKYNELIYLFNVSGQSGDENMILEGEIDLEAEFGDELAEKGIVFVEDDTKVSIRVTFQKEPKQKVQIMPREIELRNVPEGMVASINMEGAYSRPLEVAGYSGPLLASDLRPYIDLAGKEYKVGHTYRMEVMIDPKLAGITKKGSLVVAVTFMQEEPVDPTGSEDSIEPLSEGGTEESAKTPEIDSSGSGSEGS